MPHLSKTLKTTSIAICAIIIIAATVAGAVYLANHQGRGNSAAETCSSGHHANHQVTIEDNTVSPAHTIAPRCDTMTITNLDNTERLMAFGPHEHHVPYDGVGEKLLGQGQSLTVTLIQPGNFMFHDHIHDEVRGTFTVTGR